MRRSIHSVFQPSSLLVRLSGAKATGDTQPPCSVACTPIVTGESMFAAIGARLKPPARKPCDQVKYSNASSETFQLRFARLLKPEYVRSRPSALRLMK